MSSIVISRACSRRGLLSCLTIQPKAKFSCGSCGNAWKKISRPLVSTFQMKQAGLSTSPQSLDKLSLASDKLRMKELAIDDINSEESKAAQTATTQQKFATIEELLESDPALRSPDYFQVHNLFTVRDLYEARVHLGHKTGSLNKGMTDFVFGSRFDSVIFDLDKTAFHLRQALNFTAHIAYRKGIILFVSRSPQTMHLVEQTAIECGEYAHCREWHTHVMTNSENKFGGITRLPDLIILLNTLDTVMATHGAVFDANKMLIPTVGIVDSNCDPNIITYPVPGNDDSLPSVQFYCRIFKEAIMRGKQKRRSLENQQQETSSITAST